MVELLARLFDGPRGAFREAGPARAAIARQRRVRVERHVGEDRHQPEARAELRVDQEVVAPEPPQPGRDADVLVWALCRSQSMS